jgi:hypothetical protein
MPRDRYPSAVRHPERAGRAPHVACAATVPANDSVISVIEETARHCGRLDLLRERIEGQSGE